MTRSRSAALETTPDADASDDADDRSPASRPRKTVSESRVEMSRLMRPKHANFADNVHGGVLLGLMDEVAYLCASRYAGCYCVTVAVDRVEFRAPVRVGDEVTLEAAVHAVGRSSMQVGISVYAEDPQDPDSRRSANRSFFTMVARTEEGDPARVPALVCETAEDRRLRCEAELRRELQDEFSRKLEEGMCRFEAS